MLGCFGGNLIFRFEKLGLDLNRSMRDGKIRREERASGDGDEESEMGERSGSHLFGWLEKRTRCRLHLAA